MNTANMPEEEELDRIFRQAADSYEPEFEPEAWQEMEKKLDATTRPKSFWHKKWQAGLLLLLVGLTSIFIYRQLTNSGNIPANTNAISTTAPTHKENPTTNKTSENRAAGSTATQPARQAQNTGSGNKKTNRSKPGTSGNKPVLQVPGSNLPKAIAHSNKYPKDQAQLGANAKNNPPALAIKDKTEPPVTGPEKNEQPLNTNQPVISIADTTQQQPPQSATLHKTPAVAPLDSSGLTNQNYLAAKPESIPLLPDSTPTALRADSTLNKVKPKWWTKFSISLALGPDFSTVGLVRPEKASTNVGGIVSYQISQRWAVATGIVRARKVYGAKPEDYHPGPNYWPPGSYLPNDINAVCQVLDIPVNIRYSVVALPQQAVYLQTGLSSYVMLKEDYRYDYENHGQPYSKHWIVSNQNKHLFSVLNLSVGYNYQIKPGISVGAEPFVKIPLQGIGAGKVNLTSIGTLFAVGYSFR